MKPQPSLEDAIELVELIVRLGDPVEEIEAIDIVKSHQVKAARNLGYRPSKVTSALDGLAELAAIRDFSQSPSPTLTAKETAELLGCSVRSLWRWEAQGKIPEGRRIGRTVRWDRREIENWLSAT